MRHKYLMIGLAMMVLSGVVVGCRATDAKRTDRPKTDSVETPARQRTARPIQSNRPGDAWPEGTQALAFIAGRPVTAAMLYPRLIEHAGGQVLAEVILDQLVDQQLAQRGLVISPDMIQQERQLLLDELSSDPNEAVRLLDSLRQTRGITAGRFNRTLRRNAALRRLVRDEVEVTPIMLRQAFDLQYGQKYEARIITAATLGDMQRVIRLIEQGGSFMDVAIEHSTDPSRAQGGLLSPMSLADATYPAVVRDTLATLDEGQVSQPVAIEQGYALLKLERKIAARKVKFDDVKDDLVQSVMRQNQARQMRLLARSLMEQADVLVLDPTIKQSWDHQKTLLNQTP